MLSYIMPLINTLLWPLINEKMSGLSVAELTQAQPQTVLVTQCKVCHWAWMLLTIIINITTRYSSYWGSKCLEHSTKYATCIISLYPKLWEEAIIIPIL